VPNRPPALLAAGVTRLGHWSLSPSTLRQPFDETRDKFVERALVHAEPMARTHLRYAVPLVDPGGTLSEHFGEAPYFALVTVRLADGAVEEQQILANPHQREPKAKGIRVAEWLVTQKADVVLLKEDLSGKGPAYAFGDAGVEVRQTEATTLSEALADAGFSELLASPGEG